MRKFSFYGSNVEHVDNYVVEEESPKILYEIPEYARLAGVTSLPNLHLRSTDIKEGDQPLSSLNNAGDSPTSNSSQSPPARIAGRRRKHADLENEEFPNSKRVKEQPHSKAVDTE